VSFNDVVPARGNPYRVFFTPLPAMAYDPSQLTVGTDACTLSRPTTGPFSMPACGTDGNVGRNSYRGPHCFGEDMAIAKNFAITERIRMQFRLDAFNMLNHAIFSSQDYNATGGA
jgi:hypothetical protein